MPAATGFYHTPRVGQSYKTEYKGRGHRFADALKYQGRFEAMFENGQSPLQDRLGEGNRVLFLTLLISASVPS